MTGWIVFGPYAFKADQVPVLLAPMSGVSDAPFRRQANRFGSQITITEMVAGDDLAMGRREALQRFRRPAQNAPYIVQLVGREAEALKSGAQIAHSAGADVIDINMGCPSRRVTGGLSGSALMKDLERAETLISAVLEGAQGTPVTLKMRLGWDRDTINAPELARIAEALGVELVTVHGRTRQDFYKGQADWEAVSPVVEAVQLPVIVNGDIVDASSAREAIRQSGAHGVMIGRAATGCAWLPSAVETALSQGGEIIPPDFEIHLSSLEEQAVDSVALYGERVGIRVIRKHLAEAFRFWASYTPEQADRLRTLSINTCRSDSLSALRTLLKQAREQHLEVAA